MDDTARMDDALACEWQKRPPGAPTFDDLAASVRAVRRDGATLVVAYDPGARALLERVVEAERLCCPGIGWEIAAEDGLSLRITATPGQIDLLDQLVRAPARDR